MFYNDCPVDPAHPCRHPIFDTTKFVTEPYDPATLTPEQLAWEAKRAARRSRARAPPPPPVSDDSDSDYEDEEDSKDSSANKKKNKSKDFLNYKPRLLPTMADHDFDGTFKECTECGSKLWGTKTIFPLSQPVHYVSNAYIKAPICIACKMLFSSVRSQKDKNDIIIWMLTGQFEGKKTEFPKDHFIKRCRNIKSSMRTRSERMRRSKEERLAREAFGRKARKTELKKELKREMKKHVSKSKVKMSEKRVKQIELSIRQRFNISRKRIKRQFQKEEVEVATAEELSELVEKRKYCDALLGWTLEMDDREKFNSLTFDHIEPVTHVKHNNGSFGIGNIQPLSKVLNNIKGSYNEKELCRWLILFLKSCHRKYAPK